MKCKNDDCTEEATTGPYCRDCDIEQSIKQMTWEHVGLVVMNELAEERRLAELVADERANLIREVTQQKIEEIAAGNARWKMACDQFAVACANAGHLFPVIGTKTCWQLGSRNGVPWCRWREMEADAKTRSADRPMLVRVTIYPEVKE